MIEKLKEIIILLFYPKSNTSDRYSLILKSTILEKFLFLETYYF
jgi:hypothetical protein